MKDSITRRISPKELQISAGSVRDVNSESNRIAYTAWTAPGSSGSPVLNASFELIGLHHHGEHLVNNHGVIIRAIFNDLARKAPGLMQGRATSANPNIESQVFAVQRESPESANTSPTYIFEGKRKLEFEKRLLDDWRSLATLLEIPAHKRNTWEKGYEADAIWNYLNAKRELNKLPEALIYVEREDLAQLFL